MTDLLHILGKKIKFETKLCWVFFRETRSSAGENEVGNFHENSGSFSKSQRRDADCEAGEIDQEIFE